MPRRLLAAMLLLCASGLPVGNTHAQAMSEEPPSMRFEWVREGPPEICGDRCREWIAATGPITADTARDFDFFTQVRDVRGATLVLDSGGGSVLASLELGRKVRELRMATTVGRTTLMSTPAGEQPRAKMSPRGECASMCVFVLLGGVQRVVPPEARILVHQIWPGGKRYDPNAENYSAEEMVRIQRDVGRIARYTVEMGGDIELFELAMRIPPWERLRSLSQAELRRMRLQTTEAKADAPTSGTVAAPRPKRVEQTLPRERGWTVVEAAQTPALSRSHPLTAEGDEVGHFELSLSCAQAGGSFTISYQETRAIGEGADSSRRLKDVTLWASGERAVLHVDSSGAGGPDEIKSVASGTVAASFLAKLRDDPTAVVIVGTKTTDNFRTSTRVGGTGFGHGLAQIAAGCRKQLHASAEPVR